MHRKLAIAVEAISELDHQARILIDGEDWLGPEFAGLDPPMLETELLDKGVGTLIVGRCWCGSVGCNALKVGVTRTERSVQWEVSRTDWIRFNPAQYDAELARFAQDRSWESLQRRVMREIRQIFQGTTIRGGFEFAGASTWMRSEVIFLSFRKGHRERSLKFKWDGVSVADAISRAKVFRAERFSHCD